MAQLINITSEALQATIRRLLPSQQGFGEDLQASNVITPVIDLTPTAEGSSLPQYLQTALNFGGATEFEVANTTTALISTPGFYRVIGTISNRNGGSDNNARFTISDGLSTKTIYGLKALNDSNTQPMAVSYDFTVFLDTGETLSATSGTNVGVLTGSVRQVADRYGTVVNPTGFTFE